MCRFQTICKLQFREIWDQTHQCYSRCAHYVHSLENERWQRSVVQTKFTPSSYQNALYCSLDVSLQSFVDIFLGPFTNHCSMPNAISADDCCTHYDKKDVMSWWEGGGCHKSPKFKVRLPEGSNLRKVQLY